MIMVMLMVFWVDMLLIILMLMALMMISVGVTPHILTMLAHTNMMVVHMIATYVFLSAMVCDVMKMVVMAVTRGVVMLLMLFGTDKVCVHVIDGGCCGDNGCS